MKLISIELDHTLVSAVQGSVRNGVVSVTNAAQATLPEDAMKNGHIEEEFKVRGVLLDLLREHNMTAKHIILTISLGETLVRRFSVPYTKKNQLRGLVRNQMVMNFGAQASDVIEFKEVPEELDADVPEEERPNGKHVHVCATALHEDYVLPAYHLIRQMKRDPMAMDVHMNVIEKLLSFSPSINGRDITEGASLLLDFGEQRIIAYVVLEGEVVLSRQMPIGLSDFQDDGALFGETPERVDILGTLDLTDENLHFSPLGTRAEEVLLQIVNELKKLLMFSASKLKKRPVETIFLFGEGSRLKGVETYLGGALLMETQVIQTVSTLRFLNGTDRDGIAGYINAAAALIRLK